jgi:sRNA-binding regulator protein Hfq
MQSSTLYTIGTALDRAKDNDLPVDVLVEGHWLTGRVVATDGHGVLLNCEEREHALIRMSNVAAVRVHSPAPQTQITVDAYAMNASPSAYGAYS